MSNNYNMFNYDWHDGLVDTLRQAEEQQISDDTRDAIAVLLRRLAEEDACRVKITNTYAVPSGFNKDNFAAQLHTELGPKSIVRSLDIDRVEVTLTARGSGTEVSDKARKLVERAIESICGRDRRWNQREEFRRAFEDQNDSSS